MNPHQQAILLTSYHLEKDPMCNLIARWSVNSPLE